MMMGVGLFGANRAFGEWVEVKLGSKEARRTMSMQRLMSAAHAAGYAMAAEDFDPEPLAAVVKPAREARALALRAPTPLTIELLRLRRTFRSLRRALVSDWVTAHWSGRAPA